MSLTRDDLRAAVSVGTITEAQAASILSLSDARRGARENLSGLDEPFELFKGFNEIFIVVGLTILYAGWAGLTGLSVLFVENPGAQMMLYAGFSMAAVAGLAAYFTLKRRMIAPSIALSIMFAISAMQFGSSLGDVLSNQTPTVWAIASGFTGAWLFLYWAIFRVPFTLLLVAISVFGTTFTLTLVSGASLMDARQMFLLSGTGPFSILKILLGFIGLTIALWFDMSDPHRVTRRAQNGFWLHIIAAPAIVNTVALTLFESDTTVSLLLLTAFLALMAIFAIVIDRRSFLVAAIGYVVALAITVIEGNAFLVILMLGAGLVFLGARWEAMRRTIMSALPEFPGKSSLPPYAKENS